MISQALKKQDSPFAGKVQTKLAMRDFVREALDTGVLFAGNSEVIINHGPEVYRLRLTRQNKLILTK